MTTSITIARNERGNDEAHVTGCSHLRQRHLVVRADGMAGWAGATFAGETLVEAIRAADTDMAGAFGQKVYDPDPSDQPWTVSVMAAPCVLKSLRDAGYSGFAETGEPKQKRGTEMTAKTETAPKARRTRKTVGEQIADVAEAAVKAAPKTKAAPKEPRMLKLRVQYAVTVNVDAWRAAYGDSETPDQIREAVRAAVQSVIPSSAVFAEGIVVSADEVGLGGK